MAEGRETEADVVIVGGGGAGLAAAVEAARAGARVVLLEKNPALGGTTLRSVGSVTATRTALQLAAGVADSPDEHFEDLGLFNRQRYADADARDNPELRRVLVDAMAETLEFLTDAGVVFFGPMPEPPHRKPRMHNVLPHSRSFIFNLARAARDAGADIRTGWRAGSLLRADGRVTGVHAEGADGARDFTARRGVVLASGDFSAGAEIRARFLSPDLAAVEAINPTSTGDGHAMALAAGAEIVNGDVVWGPEIRFVAPPGGNLVERLPPWKPIAHLVRLSMKVLPDVILRPFLMMFLTTNLAPSYTLFEEGAVLVNRDGRRFCDERDRPEHAIPAQPGGLAWIVFDDAIARRFTAWPYYISTAPGIAYAYLPDYRRNRKDVTHSAQTPEALAAKIGVPGDALAETLAGCDAPALIRPPFHALGPAKSWIAFTDGGLKVSTRLEVLDGDGAPIPGLYAAGSTGQGGLLLEGHGHHLGWAFASGRIAGRNAAEGAG